MTPILQGIPIFLQKGIGTGFDFYMCKIKE